MILNAKKRRRIAFRLAFQVLFSYSKLKLVKLFLSEDSYQKKLSKLHIKNAEKLKQVILKLNGLFIKVGQLLSILSNILPKTYSQVLETLQDKTPHSDFNEIKPILETELQDTFINLFESFEKEPIASASIGQVNKAVLKTGEIVAVKIQHPYIPVLSKVDLDIIEKIIFKFNRVFKVNGIEHAFEQVKKMIQEELDYTVEANSMNTIKINCSNIEGILIPKVYKEYSSSKILVTSFCEGVKITNTQKLKKWDIEPNKIAKKLIYTYCEMLLNHGIYHADPHPGNLLVNKNGELIFIDFGAIGELKEEMRTNIPTFLQAIIAEDNEKTMKCLQEMGFIEKGQEKEEATKKIVAALSDFLAEAISSNVLNVDSIKQSSLFKLKKELSLKELTSTLNVPKDWILLERTILLLYGITTNIAPNYKAMDTIKPYLKKLVFKDGGLKKIVIDTIKQQATTLFSLPKKIETFIDKANKGKIEINIKEYNKNSKKLNQTIQQFLFAILSTLFLFGAMVGNHFSVFLYEIIFLILGIVFGSIFLILLLKNRK